MLDKLFSRFHDIIVLDLETTGLSCRTDEIIEFGGLRLTPDHSTEKLNILLRLPQGMALPAKITELTGITQAALDTQGLDRLTACQKIVQLLDVPAPLVVTYNAQFDLTFLYYFLQHFHQASVLQGITMLDVLTIYKDRHAYPHKLADAIQTYQVDACNSHHAIDDAIAADRVLQAMAHEKDDLELYLNLFGYHPGYGISGPRIHSITYKPQDFAPEHPLYEK